MYYLRYYSTTISNISLILKKINTYFKNFFFFVKNSYYSQLGRYNYLSF